MSAPPPPPTLNSFFLSVSPSSFPRLLSLSFFISFFFFSSGEVKLTSRMLQAPHSIKYTVRAIMTSVYRENHKQSWWTDVKSWTGSFIYLFDTYLAGLRGSVRTGKLWHAPTCMHRIFSQTHAAHKSQHYKKDKVLCSFRRLRYVPIFAFLTNSPPPLSPQNDDNMAI